MSFDWSNYLSLAEYMMNKVNEFPNEEACYRSIVSRAYYATFCLARTYVKDADLITFAGNDHRELQIHLKRSGNRDKTKIGNQLERLHIDRKKADYSDDLDELPINKASKALVQARKIIEGLNQL